MAVPMLHVGAVLSNIVCTKVPIPNRPNCYRETLAPFPHRFKCCPYSHVFVNYDRICNCVPSGYAQHLKNEKFQQYPSYGKSYRNKGYHRYKKYGYGQKKKYNYGYNLSQSSPRRQPSYSVRTAEAISNKVKVASAKNTLRKRANQFTNLKRKSQIQRKVIPFSQKSIQPIKRVIKSTSKRGYSNKQINKKISFSQRRKLENSISKARNLHNLQKQANTPSVSSSLRNAVNKQKKVIQNAKIARLPTTKMTLPNKKREIPLKTKIVKNLPKSTKNKLQSNSEKSHSGTNVIKPKISNRDISNDLTQTLISNSKNSKSVGNIPIYYLNYDFQNGIVVKMPVIYEYHLVLPPGIDRAIPLPNSKGFLVPFSIFVQSSGRFVYNPAILRRHPSLLSHIRLAKQRGITLEPIPLKRDTNTIQELSSFLNTRSHRFDDIIFENNMAADQLHGVFPLEGQDPSPRLHFLGSGHGAIQSNAPHNVDKKFHSFGKVRDQNSLLTLEKGWIFPNKRRQIGLVNPKSITFNSSSNIPKVQNGKINLQLQNVRVLSNRDFLDKNINIRKTFHPNWIPDLDLFRMLTNGQPLENQLYPKLERNFQKTGKSSSVDLHNVLSTIPLDSKFDLKTNKLDRPLPDIPGPLSLRNAANKQNKLLHFAGIRKGPVVFPSSRVFSNVETNSLAGSLQSDSNGMFPQNSVPIPSGGFVFNVSKSLNSLPIVKNEPQILDHQLPNIIIPNDPPLDPQEKVTLNFKEMSTRKLFPQEMAAAKLNQKLLNTLEGKVGLSAPELVNSIQLSSTGTSKTLSNEMDRVGTRVQSVGVIRPSASQVDTFVGHMGSNTPTSLETSFADIGLGTPKTNENTIGNVGLQIKGLPNPLGLVGSDLTERIQNSVGVGRIPVSRNDLRVSVQDSKVQLPFNPRMQTDRGPFKFRTFFKLPPRFKKTGSSSNGNDVIGIIKSNAKVYPIPIFPGAISGNIGEPVYQQTENGLDVFNGNEYSAFLDPTTNLPVGFTVKKFDYEVGGVVDLLQNKKPKTVNEKKKVGVVTKEKTRERSGVLKLLDNNAIIDEIVTVLRRKGPLKPNENELVIPPKIIDSKSRNNIIMYLKNVKMRKHDSAPQMPSDLIKLLKNPVFVRYIRRNKPVKSNNTMNIPETNKVGLIFDRIDVSREPIPKKKKTLASGSSASPTIKSNTKIMTSKSNKAKAFVNTKQMPPIVQKGTAKIIKKDETVISLPPVPVLKFDSILDLKQRKTLKMNLTKELCRGCTIDGGLGYANHPSRCDRFVVCYPGEGGNVVPIEQECAYGLFWSQTALTCRLPKDVLCPYDKCRKSAEKLQYSHEGNCKAFWECRDGYSVPQCCPSGMAFGEGKGCVKNVGFCKSRCPIGESEIQPVFLQGECDKRAVPGSPDKFERHVYFQSNPGVPGRIQQEWMIQQCSPGTEFRPEVCDCRSSETLTNLLLGKRVCSPDVYLPFTHGLTDESIARTHVRADNVTITTSGTACFSGQSVLAMARFANMDLGSYLYVKIRYRHVLSNPKNEVLLYNGDCERKPSLILGSTVDGNFVSVLSTTGEMHTIRVKSPIPATEWRTVTLVIDNGSIKVTSDSQTSEKNAVGVVERAQCGMKIGWGEGYEHFNGCIDDFTLYRCNPDRPIGS